MSKHFHLNNQLYNLHIFLSIINPHLTPHPRLFFVPNHASRRFIGTCSYTFDGRQMISTCRGFGLWFGPIGSMFLTFCELMSNFTWSSWWNPCWDWGRGGDVGCWMLSLWVKKLNFRRVFCWLYFVLKARMWPALWKKKQRQGSNIS